jgi:thiamine-phosphate pyrophosphorylase
MIRFTPDHLRLYLVLDPGITRGDPVETAIAAASNGITCLQLRWKSATDRDLCALADRLAGVCAAHRIPFIVNDRLDIALAVGAGGVHLGVDDLPIPAARRLGGPEFIVGYSPETDGEIAAAAEQGVTYLGLGPFATTKTKADAGPALGPEGFARRRALTGLPVVAIGGIDHANAAAAMQAGASGIAVASAIAGAEVPAAATHRLLAAMVSPA